MLRLFVTWVLQHAAHTQSRFGHPWCISNQRRCDVWKIDWFHDHSGLAFFLWTLSTASNRWHRGRYLPCPISGWFDFIDRFCEQFQPFDSRVAGSVFRVAI